MNFRVRKDDIAKTFNKWQNKDKIGGNWEIEAVKQRKKTQQQHICIVIDKLFVQSCDQDTPLVYSL